jgi:hypothetical protein
MRTRVTRNQYEAAYREARLVHEGKSTKAASLDRLEKENINRTTADFYIYRLHKMLLGERYKKAMSVESTEAFLSWIFLDYGQSGLRNAVSSLEQHIPYFRESSPSPMKGHVAALEKYRGYLQPDENSKSALKDLLDPPPGNSTPDHAERTGSFIKRNPMVRAYVIGIANGRCEYCGCEGFPLTNGTKYVEAHHVIALAKDGEDTVENVIALCANHHREAHFGAGASALEQQFIEIIAQRNAP